ncbi:LOW QUALITY PROTEIN: F-box protein PP2-B3-like [Pistacia vera]|uniref:LOW QUALITY PROTEIN: F-box protein PP2-B3-like n=1 Tax=Pistacia vera TaxID=55513 RepID=UPI0012633445|nr:LOW QUALITY PROTEIN: F-box protein PP2-B3-like [Pistacia vera]
MNITAVLPEECLSQIISLTSPRDAANCKVSVVSPLFKSATDSDAVWERLLPSDYHEIVSDSVSSSELLVSLSKKDLYFHLCHNPILIKKGTMSFALDKESGKKCYMFGVTGLYITWRGIKVKIETKILSPKTTYGVYVVYKFPEFGDGLQRGPIQLSFCFEGREQEKHTVFVTNMGGPISRQ